MAGMAGTVRLLAQLQRVNHQSFGFGEELTGYTYLATLSEHLDLGGSGN